MSDERLRALERDAAGGDALAAERLGDERCRRGLHDTHGSGLVYWRMTGDGPAMAGAVIEMWTKCARCGQGVPVPGALSIAADPLDGPGLQPATRGLLAQLRDDAEGP